MNLRGGKYFVTNLIQEIKRGGRMLLGTKDQTREIRLKAAKQFGCVLQFAEDQTSEICLEAIKQFGCTSQLVKDQTPERCLGAIRENPEALEFVNPELNQEVMKVLKDRATKEMNLF